ncbi:hypothetical protein GKR75_07450, partial [Providencia sp. wls1919]|nr:hypothetical protein [Providencia sp. wls1919]
WLWRADFAYSLLLLGYLFYIKDKYFLFFIFSVLSIFSHYSSLPLLLLLITFFSFSKNIKSLSEGIKILLVIIFAIACSYIYKIVKRSFTSGEGNWVSSYYLGNLLLLYFAIGLFLLIFLFYTKKWKFSKNLYNFSLTVILNSIFSFIISLSSNGNHQDITRIMHISFLLFCILIPLIFPYGNKLQKMLILIYLTTGCIGTIYLVINFTMAIS